MAADETSRKTETLKMRVSPAEKTAIEAGATHLGLATSEFLRQAALEKTQRDVNVSVGAAEPDELGDFRLV